ncbi:hypothetical protein PAXRUDRAFT_14722 [Paxillus rubicundulus Ve08.2h10]|uniref:Unplaced genomic scaffold scaffold_802, whole genome shotgun sequence n=1 Tax=Paxillus rubicundulus Ve08.2h10 TaxID=930991 RepID=A0A0D0D365_9AGAM|nr:hypothetical protein PAXRUDRAFT_14722 [Paxillus rubicundulus Ve08.2h10]
MDLYDDNAEDISGSSRSLTDAGKAARKELKQLVVMKFRFVCNIPEGKPWPKPDEVHLNLKTGEQYLTLKFDTNVNDGHNHTIFGTVANQVWTDLQTAGTAYTYCYLKEDWRAQNIPVKQAAKVDNQRGNRWTQRRKEATQWLILAQDTYLAKHGVDPVPIVYAEHMSDEGSRPEDDSDEAKDAWKTDMARKAGLAADADLDSMSFLEVMKCPWHSEELGDIYHKLYELWRSSLMAQQKKCFHSIRICDTE